MGLKHELRKMIKAGREKMEELVKAPRTKPKDQELDVESAKMLELVVKFMEELDIGVVTAVPGVAKGLEAKARIAELLDIKINCVERLKRKTGLVPEHVARSLSGGTP